jgi:homoserine trans-succinylase
MYENSCTSGAVTHTVYTHVAHTVDIYRGADKSLARPSSRCILFEGENISFDASLVIYVNSTNISLSMMINRIYETHNLMSL